MPRSDPPGQTVRAKTVHAPGLHRCQTVPPALSRIRLHWCSVRPSSILFTACALHYRRSQSRYRCIPNQEMFRNGGHFLLSSPSAMKLNN